MQRQQLEQRVARRLKLMSISLSGDLNVTIFINAESSKHMAGKKHLQRRWCWKSSNDPLKEFCTYNNMIIRQFFFQFSSHTSSFPHLYLSKEEVLLGLPLPLLLLLQLLRVHRFLFYDHPPYRPRLLHSHRRWWRRRRRGEPLVLSELLFRFLRMTLVLPGRSWGAGAHCWDLVGGLGHDLQKSRKMTTFEGEREAFCHFLQPSHAAQLNFKPIVQQVTVSSEYRPSEATIVFAQNRGRAFLKDCFGMKNTGLSWQQPSGLTMNPIRITQQSFFRCRQMMSLSTVTTPKSLNHKSDLRWPRKPQPSNGETKKETGQKGVQGRLSGENKIFFSPKTADCSVCAKQPC